MSMIKKIDLYCPCENKSKNGFQVSSFQSHSQVLQSIRLTLGVQSIAAVYDVHAKPIVDLQTCNEGQCVQVATTYSEQVKSYAPKNTIVYRGEEGNDVGDMMDGYGLPWEVSKC
jgi:hypothetical protein